METIQKFTGMLKQRSTAVGAVAAALTLAAAVLIVQSDPRSEIDVQLSDGAVWLASNAIGGVSLLDGGSGTIAASLGVAEPGDDFSVEQFGSDAVIVNRTDGTVARLDGSSWEIATGRVQLGEPGSALDVVTGDAGGWLMTPGQATTVELEELALRTPVPVAAPFADGIVTDDGALLYASTDPAIAVQRFDAAGGGSSTIDGLDGPTALIDLGPTVAAVDLDDRSVWLEGDGTVCERLEFPDGAVLHAGGGDGLMIVVSDQGGAFAWDPAVAGCPAAPQFLNLGPGTYGDPAVTDGWAVVPEIATASVLVIDLESRSVVSRQDLDGVADGTEVSLIAEDGAVWYNDADSSHAGLIRRDGTIVPIAKYEEGASGFTAAPVDDAADDADDVSIAGASDAQLEEEPPEAETVAGPEISTTTTTTPSEGGDTDEPDPEGPAATTTTTAPSTPETTDNGVTETTNGGVTETTNGGVTETTDGSTTTTEGTTTTTERVDGVEVSIGASAQSVTAGETINFTIIVNHGDVTDFGAPTISPSGPQLLPAEVIGQFRILFPEAGTFTISFTPCDADGQCDTAITQVAIVEDPDAIPLVAAIDGPSTVVVGETATFRDISQGDPESQTWGTRNGTPASGTGATFDTSFDFPGPRQVTLTVTRGGISRTATFDVDVVAAPTPAPFGLSCSLASAFVGETVTCQLDGTPGDFSDISFSTNSDGAAGFTSSSPSPGRFTLSSTQERTVTVSLTATDDGTGDSRSDNATVTFRAPACAAVLPTVNVSGPTTLEVGTAGSFSATPTTGCGSVSRAWSATGGASISNPSANDTTISWASAGTYTVTFDFRDGGGPGSDSMTVTVTEPVVGPSAPSITVGGPGSLDTDENGTYTVTNNGGPIDSYSWTTNGGGGSGSGSTFTGSWPNAGSYTVTLSVTGPGGTDTATRNVTVTDPPTPPSPFGMTCDVASADTDTIFSCDLTTGNPANFSNPQWSAPGAQTWLMNPFSYDVQGTTPGTTVTVTLTAVDLATGQTVSSSDSVSITSPVPQPANLTMGCDQGSAEMFEIVTCSITSGNQSSFTNPTWTITGDHDRWGGGFVLDVAGNSAGTLGITLSATDVGTGQVVSASTSLTVTAIAPPPANMTISCPGSVSVGQRFNCSLTSGNAGSFSGLTWTVSPAGNRQTWGGGGSLDISGTVAGTLTVQLAGTDIGTGQVVSASATVTVS